MNVFSEVKERVSCIDIAKEFGIHLTKKGNHYVALCPFHAEKTPSFVVHPEHFYCFGCNVGGDAIAFVSKLQGLKPIDAAKSIIHQCGLTIKMDKPEKPKRKKRYSQADFLKALEAWRDETYPLYVRWYKTISEALQGMTVEMMDIPGFKALIEMKANLDYVTEKQISDDFTEILKAYRHAKGTILDITQEAVEEC